MPVNQFIEALETRRLLSLTVDVRLRDGGGKEAVVTRVGQIVRMEVWAVVTGANSTASDEHMKGLIGSFLSTNIGTGAAKGKLASVRAPKFTNLASLDGKQADLDHDGDYDVGANNPFPVVNFFGARGFYKTPQQTSDNYQADRIVGRRAEWKLADLKFTTQILLSDEDTTEVNYRPRIFNQIATAWWVQDETVGAVYPQNGTLRIGAPVVLRYLPPAPPTSSAYRFSLGSHSIGASDEPLPALI
ncbi:MAG: hypothetical protein ACREJC_06230 [Tepidisphaeraceae bacterium]